MSLHDSNDVEAAWALFKCKFLEVIDNIAPFKTSRVKQGTPPWMTGEVLHLIADRDRTFKKFKKTKEPNDYEMYCKLHNMVQCKKSIAKSEFVNSKLSEYKNQPKKMWQTLKDLGTSTTTKKTALVI